MSKINKTLLNAELEKKGLQMRGTESLGGSMPDIDVVESSVAGVSAIVQTVSNIELAFSDPRDDEENYIMNLGRDRQGREHSYVMYGPDDSMPAFISETVGSDETLCSGIDFLKRITYGSGVKFCVDTDYMGEDGKPSAEQKKARNEAAAFFADNDLTMLTLMQSRNMKTYGWNLDVIIVDNAGKRITDISTRDVYNCRVAPRDKKTGRRPFAYYGKFNYYHGTLNLNNVEIIELLDERTPLRDLRVKMGVDRNPRTGLYETKNPNEPVSDSNPAKCAGRKFGILRRIQGVESRVYPYPPYFSVIKGMWYRIKKQVEINLYSKLKNGTQIKYMIKVHQKYWENKLKEYGITTGVNSPEGKAKVAELKKKLADFVCGGDNTDKTLFSGRFMDLDGKEINLVEVESIDNKVQGGDWATDITEATNMFSYGSGIHPTLVGAVPGKSTQNNSGSDKRELYTIAQANETATRDMMMFSYGVVLGFNGWAKHGVVAHIPFMQLTTLDEHKSAKEVSTIKQD